MRDNGKPEKMSDSKTDASEEIAIVRIGYVRVSTMEQK